MLIYSHRRSGTHLLMSYIEEVFHLPVKKRHILDNPNDNVVYIVRDPRDVLTSCFYWWKGSGESKVSHIAKAFKNISIEEYLQGIDVDFIPEGGIYTQEMILGMLSSPIDYWREHVERGVGNFGFIKYEDLVEKPENCMEYIAHRYRVTPKTAINKITTLVGHHPRKGIVGDHKNVLNQNCINLIEEKCSSIMKKLNYGAWNEER